jgi:hypothetical protein
MWPFFYCKILKFITKTSRFYFIMIFIEIGLFTYKNEA